MSISEDLFINFLIKKEPHVVLDYCKRAGRVEQIEKMLINDSKLASQYAIEVVKGRWEEAEESIAQDESSALDYACKIIKGRFPAYEKIISKDRNQIIHYCILIQKRWPEVEEFIAKGPTSYSIQYARHIIKGRFEVAEPKIATKPKWILDYARALGQKPSQELHNAMTMYSFQNPNDKIIKQYFQEFGP